MLIIFYAMKDKRILIIIIASIALLIAALSAANGIRSGSQTTRRGAAVCACRP